MSGPQLSILIVNYNSGPYLAACLKSIAPALTPPGGGAPVAHEILVADNDSHDDSLALAKATGVAATFIQTGGNLGFGKAMNLLAKQATAPWLFLLNPDCVLEGQGWFEGLLAFVREHPRTGVLGPKILNSDGTFQAACIRGEPTPFSSLCELTGLAKRFPRSRLWAAYHLGHLDRNAPQRVHAVSGSATLIRRKLFDDIGGFDERFFLFAEDLDLCRRAAETPERFEVWYTPSLSLTHHKGKCSEARPDFVRQHFYNAMALYYEKHYARGLGRLAWPLVKVLTRRLGGKAAA